MKKLGVESILRLGVNVGRPVVPVLPAGVDVSDGWTETEWRVGDRTCSTYFGGSWEGEPGHLFVDYTFDEFCWMTSGRVALVDSDLNRREFVAGEAFFVPRGFAGTWLTLEPSSKHFVIIE
ncbi:cupin domain-containing protein [Variovorax sp. E3]|uniref:cupin domain-containing protein n=1 Tax=Variovorax sp. E3 TaxID=1914993 RepID=UPI0018DE1A00|nr:cupin domain-containing protein [Variovorax sp. E3]